MVLALATLAASRADAQTRPDELTISWLWDGGAVPFLWATLAGRWVLESTIEPPEKPRFFADEIDGEPSLRSHELPGYVVTAGGGVVGLIIAIDDSPARWFHLKGLAQALATNAFLTGAGKVGFGRRRPDYDPNRPGDDGRRSFPSGHASQALAAGTYLGLYLARHGFDRWREPGTLPWWEVGAYLTIASLSIAVPIERVVHNRHHATDALAGSLLGAATSTIFFLYQERRYRRARSGDREQGRSLPTIVPEVSRPGVHLLWAF